MNAVSLEKFRELPREQQIAIHEEMKKSIGIEGILKKWDLSRSKYYYLLKKLKLNENKQPENGHQEFEASPIPNKPETNNLSALDFEESPTPNNRLEAFRFGSKSMCLLEHCFFDWN